MEAQQQAQAEEAQAEAPQDLLDILTSAPGSKMVSQGAEAVRRPRHRAMLFSPPRAAR
jgi:hypothetical protein